MKQERLDKMLSAAVTTNKVSLARTLLEKGANADGYMNYGTPPRSLLSQAVTFGHAEIAGLLVEYGADAKITPGSKAEIEKSPIWYATTKRKWDLVEAMVPHLVHVQSGPDGNTLLHWVEYGYNPSEPIPELEKLRGLLLAHGANPDTPNQLGHTPNSIHNKKMAPILLAREQAERQKKEAQALAARQRQLEEEKRKEEQKSGFQWGKFAALAGGMAVGAIAAGGVGETTLVDNAEMLLEAMQDSMPGQNGMSSMLSSIEEVGRRHSNGQGAGTHMANSAALSEHIQSPAAQTNPHYLDAANRSGLKDCGNKKLGPIVSECKLTNLLYQRYQNAISAGQVEAAKNLFDRHEIAAKDFLHKFDNLKVRTAIDRGPTLRESCENKGGVWEKKYSGGQKGCTFPEKPSSARPEYEICGNKNGSCVENDS